MSFEAPQEIRYKSQEFDLVSKQYIAAKSARIDTITDPCLEDLKRKRGALLDELCALIEGAPRFSPIP